MALDFSIFDGRLDESYVTWLLGERAIEQALHFQKLWGYYRNASLESGIIGDSSDSGSARPYRQAQEYGLPPRITGRRHAFYAGLTHGEVVHGIERKEVVIENDIAWRIDALVDFLFGKPVALVCRAADPQRARQIEQICEAVFTANGGANFFQELALLGGVYGFVDVIVRPGERFFETAPFPTSTTDSAGPGLKPAKDALARAGEILLEVIEAPRSLPVLAEDQYQRIEFYLQHYRQLANRLETPPGRLALVDGAGRFNARPAEERRLEVIGPHAWQRYADEQLIAEGINPLGVVPVVHIQNMSVPGQYEGPSDVEPLIPLQDELNTRLSDRASRITFGSFRMYLGKGIDGFEQRAVGPGRMWSTENPDAAIEEFGGDAGSPSEEQHIREIREALEKTSGVGSVAAGILTGKVGNLTSAVALQVTLMGLLSKTERKRRTYGRGIRDICRLILLSLDKAGIFPTAPAEREIDIRWPNPLPENVEEKLREAKLKRELGIDQHQILEELGYQA